MRVKLVLVCLALVVLAASANAFPLSGGNGIENVTVVGVYESAQNVTVLDLISTDHNEDVVLVDADDKFHQIVDYNYGETGVGEYYLESSKYRRHLYAFDGVSKTEIKRVRIAPSNGDPFSIEWTGVPEVKGIPLSVKFYGLQSIIKSLDEKEREVRYNRYDAYKEVSDNRWIADVKLTNTGNDSIEIRSTEFAITDQYGFVYETSKSNIQTVTLLSGESMRTNIVFEKISILSRPMFLIYKPTNITMDISAWA